MVRWRKKENFHPLTSSLKRGPKKYFCEMITKMVYNPIENTPVKMGEKRAVAKVLGIKTGGMKTADLIRQIQKAEDNFDRSDSVKIAVIK